MPSIRTVADDIIIEKLKGRYRVITTVITAIGVIVVGAAIGGGIVGLGYNEKEVDLNSYVDMEKYDALSGEYDKLLLAHRDLEKKLNIAANSDENYQMVIIMAWRWVNRKVSI